ncbi:MAG TPA: restriction endonuclease subunit S [Puia sp.]|nr:restriction endonuclease subunit S [Puia sp.]
MNRSTSDFYLVKNIASLQFGFYSKPIEKGDIMYLQAKNFNELGDWNAQIDTWLDINDKSQGHLLQDGDILFVGKGMRNFAWTYYEEMGKAIASSIFFVIRPDKRKIIPDYLTTLFNTPKYQGQFQTMGAGSSIPSIRKNELEDLIIPLPSLAVQESVVEISKLHKEELALTGQIIAEKNKLFQAVLKNVINI